MVDPRPTGEKVDVAKSVHQGVGDAHPQYGSLWCLGELDLGQGFSLHSVNGIDKGGDIVRRKGSPGVGRLETQPIIRWLKGVGVVGEPDQLAAERPKVLKGMLQAVAEAGGIDCVLVGKGELDFVGTDPGKDVVYG